MTLPAPIIMFTGNQINFIVPYEVEQVLQTSTQTASIQVSVTTTTAGVTAAPVLTAALTVTVLPGRSGPFHLCRSGTGTSRGAESGLFNQRI